MLPNLDISLHEPQFSSSYEIQSDEIMHAKFKDEKYNIWKTTDIATEVPFAFPMSYLC